MSGQFYTPPGGAAIPMTVGPAPTITDEQVERAARVLCAHDESNLDGLKSYANAATSQVRPTAEAELQRYLNLARAALEAALLP